MKWWQNKFFRNYIIITLTFLILELEFKLISGLQIINWSSIRIILGINIISLLLSFILSKLPNLINKIIRDIILLIGTIYGILELGFKNFLGVYASISTSSQVDAVISYVKDFLSSFNWQYYLLLIPFIFVLIYDIFIDKKVVLDMPKKKINTKYIFKKISLVFIYILIICLYIGSLNWNFMRNKAQYISNKDLFLKPNNPSLIVSEFGYIGYGLLDVKEYLFPGKENNNITLDYNPEEIPKEEEQNEQIVIDNDYWKSIIEAEKNTNYNTLNKYFISNDTTYTNNYTGLFANKNVIVIMMESGSNLLINEDLYPNFTKLYKEGWSWKNYYSPRNSCSTGNNEMSGMTSLYTIYNNCTANVYKNNTYFESIFNLFNNKGYYTNSFHDHFDAYYYRTTIHKNMGSQKFYKVQDMHIPYGHSYGDWASDEDMMRFYLDTLDNRNIDTPFMSWITTVTTHMPYSNSSIYNDKYYDLTPIEYSKDVRHYMSKLKVLDNALGILLEGLEERNILDDTVIVLYADHYPYALKNADLSEALGYEINIDNNSDNVPLVIYNSKEEAKTFDNYTSYIDITPTLANLFDLNFDSRLYVGKDIFSNDQDMVIFADGSWKNEYAFYDASTNNIKYYTEKVYSDEELLAINEKISLKLKMSSLAIKNNYFKYLKGKLDDYNSSSSS